MWRLEFILEHLAVTMVPDIPGPNELAAMVGQLSVGALQHTPARWFARRARASSQEKKLEELKRQQELPNQWIVQRTVQLRYRKIKFFVCCRIVQFVCEALVNELICLMV
jgi:hypothetical protein